MFDIKCESRAQKTYSVATNDNNSAASISIWWSQLARARDYCHPIDGNT